MIDIRYENGKMVHNGRHYMAIFVDWWKKKGGADYE